MRGVSDRELELPKAVIGELLKIANERKDIISLGAGEPDFKTPEPILKHVTKVIDKSTHYSSPDGRLDLRKEIVKKLKKDNKINCNHENILVTSGSQEAIFNSLLTILDPKDQVIIGNPSYLAYLPAVELVSGVPKFFKISEEDNFQINPDNIKKAANKKRSKVLILNTPSNPTGTVLSKKILEEIADIAVENDLYIISDEAYEKIVYDKKHVSIGSLNGMNNYVITTQTFSKSYAMCGFRVGYAVAPKKLVEAMDKVKHYVTLTPPHISQLLALKALKLNKKYIDEMVQEYRRRRDYIVKRLNELGLRTIMPEGAFYALSNYRDFSKQDSYKFSRDLLRKGKVAVVPGEEFGKYGNGYIRFSYAAKMNNIKEGLDRVEKYLSRLK